MPCTKREMHPPSSTADDKDRTTEFPVQIAVDDKEDPVPTIDPTRASRWQ
jgi:hypothetical protein